MKRFLKTLAISACIVSAVVSLTAACPFTISQRAWLDRRFWRPFHHLIVETIRQYRTKEPTIKPFAGFAPEGAQELIEARTAYRQVALLAEAEEVDPAGMLTACDAARKSVEQARRLPDLTSAEQDELELLAAKVDFRQGESGSREHLERARGILREFLKHSRTPLFRSEARGWLARSLYLLKEYPAAAKIYLDELAATDSNVGNTSLEVSLRLVLNRENLAADIGDYFDTPEHALFAIRHAAQSLDEGRDPALMRRMGNDVLQLAERHRELFSAGKGSEELALALMRVALFMGSPDLVLKYAERIPPRSEITRSPDYCWMLASVHFLRKEFAAAEPLLLATLKAPDASLLRKGKAAMALIGVYERLKRPQDELGTALELQWIRSGDAQAGLTQPELYGTAYAADYIDVLAPFTDAAFDLPYLLDVQLPAEEIAKYLEAHPDCSPIVPYSLAVRAARREDYDKAAELYARAGSEERSNRMREVGRLFAAASDPGLSNEARLQARFDYAYFLSRNSCRVFFNDQLWEGFQTSAFLVQRDIEYYPSFQRFDKQEFSGLTREERQAALDRERRLKDEQEEYWRACRIFDSIVRESGHSPLGVKAAWEAIGCLNRINPRFGRDEEIEAERKRLVAWLRPRGKVE